MDRFDNDDTSELLPWQGNEQPGTYATSGGRPPARRWWIWITVVLAAMAVAAIAGWLAAGNGGSPQPEAAGTASGGSSQSGTPSGSPTSAAAQPPAANPPASASATANGPGRCHTSDLSVAWGPGQGAAGTTYESLVFTNTSGHACDMYGFPGMEPVDGSGHQIQLTVLRTHETPQLIALAPGAHAWAAVSWSQVDGPYTGPACSPGAAGLVVTPPDETTQLHLNSPMRICGYGAITTGPVVNHLPSGA